VIFDEFTHKEVTPINVFHAAMMLGVVGYVDHVTSIPDLLSICRSMGPPSWRPSSASLQRMAKTIRAASAHVGNVLPLMRHHVSTASVKRTIEVGRAEELGEERRGLAELGDIV
jgi:hypothetical protein